MPQHVSKVRRCKRERKRHERELEVDGVHQNTSFSSAALAICGGEIWAAWGLPRGEFCMEKKRRGGYKKASSVRQFALAFEESITPSGACHSQQGRR
jgi:hypothetical protein